jgi:hypothetical protein
MTRLTRSDRDTAATIFRFLVTPDGSKIAYTVSALAGSAELPEKKVQRVLTRLGETRILRTVATPGQPARYEIFHDVLGAAISNWRRIYVRRRERRRHLLQAAVVVLLLFGAGVFCYRLLYLPWQARQPWGSVQVLSTGNVYDLRGDFAWLGRTTPEFKTHVSFYPRNVSRLHLLVTRDWLALDVRSLCGTTINAQMLPYGMSQKLQPGDIIVLGGVAPMEFETTRSASKTTAIPGPTDWAMLIDGRSRSVRYLQANPSFIGTNSSNTLVVDAKPNTGTFLKTGFDNITTDEGNFRVTTIEHMPNTGELRADWKSGDYEYSEAVIAPGESISTFKKQKARADMPEYTVVDEVAFSYGDLPFQIVPLVSDVDRGGTVAPRPSSAH